MKVLVYGSTGWIGHKIVTLLSDLQISYVCSKVRLDNYLDLLQELDNISADGITHVLLSAGKTGVPNVDWCEDHKHEVLSVNVIAPSLIAQKCHLYGIHMTFISTGCIYEYDNDHPINGKGFTEEDKPNFQGSFYSYSKTIVENIVKHYDNVLILRVRMPISDDLHPRNFITKISRYPKVVDIPNSMTILPDLLPLIPSMMTQKLCGIFNFCNPNTLSHSYILDLYTQYIDPDFKYTIFSLEDQAKVLKAGRSNNHLDVSKLLSYFPNIPDAQVSIHSVFERIKNNKI